MKFIPGMFKQTAFWRFLLYQGPERFRLEARNTQVCALLVDNYSLLRDFTFIYDVEGVTQPPR